jgi:hypothetical protein
MRIAEGSVTDKAGDPPAGAIVALDLIEYPYRSPGGTIAPKTGAFSLKIFEGLKYRIRAAGVFDGNPVPMRSAPVDLPRNGNVPDIRLVLSTPITTRNLLQDPDARGGGTAWKFSGDAGVERTGSGSCFVVRNSGSITQDVVLPQNPTGKYLLIFGWLSSERINPDAANTGLPAFSGYLMAPRGGEINVYLQGQQLRCSATKPNTRAPAFGVFQVVPNSGRVRLFLGQSQNARVPQNGSAARFEDPGLYLFDTEEEAKIYLDHILLKKRG